MSSNGVPRPEVIVNFQDGWSYSKGVLEEAYKAGGVLEKPPQKAPKDSVAAGLKKEDIDLIVHEFEIPRAKAEKALSQNGGDVAKTLKALIHS